MHLAPAILHSSKEHRIVFIMDTTNRRSGRSSVGKSCCFFLAKFPTQLGSRAIWQPLRGSQEQHQWLPPSTAVSHCGSSIPEGLVLRTLHRDILFHIVIATGHCQNKCVEVSRLRTYNGQKYSFGHLLRRRRSAHQIWSWRANQTKNLQRLNALQVKNT